MSTFSGLHDLDLLSLLLLILNLPDFLSTLTFPSFCGTVGF